ncbi:MAG: regulatory protein RecX [Thermodesulfobacteriota bacterium]
MHQHKLKRKKGTLKDSYTSALDFLKIRDHTEFELKTKLAKKGYAEEEIDLALNKCKEFKFIDDEKFAKAFFEQEKRKLNGPLKIKQNFYKKGLSPDLCDRLLAGYEESDEEYSTALKYFLKSKFKIDKKQGTQKKAEAFMRIMSQRGFSKSVVMNIYENYF